MTSCTPLPTSIRRGIALTCYIPESKHVGEAGSEEDGLRRVKGFNDFFKLPKILGVVTLVVLSGQPEARLNLHDGMKYFMKSVSCAGAGRREGIQCSTYSFGEVGLFKPSQHIQEAFQEQLFVFHEDVVI